MTYGLGDDMEDLQRENAKLREELQAARDNMAANMGLAATLRDDLEVANLQNSELKSEVERWKKASNNNWDQVIAQIEKVEVANRLNDSLKKFALEKTREIHNVWGHVGDFMSCAHGACPANVKALAGFVDKRSPGTQNCIDCGKPVSSGNICMPCVRVRYPSGSTPTFKSNCKCTEPFTRNGVCTRCGFPV